MAYQSDETKAFDFVDEDLAGLSIFGKQLLEIVLCDVVGQVTDKQATALRVRLLTGFQQHGERCLERLSNSKKYLQIILENTAKCYNGDKNN